MRRVSCSLCNLPGPLAEVAAHEERALGRAVPGRAGSLRHREPEARRRRQPLRRPWRGEAEWYFRKRGRIGRCGVFLIPTVDVYR